MMKSFNYFVRLSLLLLGSITLISCSSSDSAPAPAPVESEPNDTTAEATAITVGAVATSATIGNFGVDADYFSFEVDTTGVVYTINSSVACDIDQQVWLYDTDGVTALVNAQDIDFAIGPDNTNVGCETITYNFTATGTYYLRVEQLGQNAEGSYKVEITKPDEAEPNDTDVTANAITVGGATYTAAIGNGGVDTDYFSFYVDTVGTYYVINPSVQCTIDQQVWLYDTDGVTALVGPQDNDNGFGPNNPEANCETITYSFAAVGTYYLRVEELGQSSEGIYGVEITKFVADEVEPNDTAVTANAVTVGAAAYTAAIGNGGADTDYFSFSVDTTGVQYTIDPSVGCTIDQQVWLYDTDGVTALVNGQDNDNGSAGNCETITYTFGATGTYYLQVQELGQSSEGIYGVEVFITPVI